MPAHCVSPPPGPSRTPRGVTKPVAARLMPHEREELEAIAEHEQRSCSAMMRLLYLRGLSDYRREKAAS